MTENEAYELLNKYKLPQKRIRHSEGVARFAFDLASEIHEKHPELPVDPQKVKVAALVHDIGRCCPGDHEINSVSILKEEGYENISSIVMHGSIYEINLLRGHDDPSLVPQTLENKIVAYSDARYRDHVVSMEERWNEIGERRKDEKEKIKSIKMAKKRFYEIEQEIQSLL